MQAFMRTLVFGVLALIVVGFSFLLIRNGAFLKVEMSTEERGPLILLSKQHVGPYHKILPTLNEVEEAAKAAGLECAETFGEFLDNPSATEMERLKSNVGCVLKTAPAAAPEGLTLQTLPVRKYVIAVFRGSPALGPYKVYGRSQDEIHRQGLTQDGPPLEIYRPLPDNGLETNYLFPVR